MNGTKQRTPKPRHRRNPVRPVRSRDQDTGCDLAHGPARVQGVQRESTMRTYTICGVMFTGNTVIQAVAKASLMYDYKQFWVYDYPKTTVVGIFRRVDPY